MKTNYLSNRPAATPPSAGADARRIAGFAAAVLVLVLLATACASRSRPVAAPCCAGEAVVTRGTAALPDRSIYQLDSRWTNDAGAGLTLTALRGRPQVIALFFARCEYSCPVLVHDMKRIQAALPEGDRARTGFVLVTFDTERDTPAVLAEYRRIHELPANWTLLRGSPDDVLELAALLGVKFKRDARGQFAHSNVLTVLDGDGEIVRQQAGLNQSPGETVAELVRLLRP